jgi:kinesin family protein C2/C3
MEKVRILSEQVDNAAGSSDTQDKLDESEEQRRVLQKQFADSEAKFRKDLNAAIKAKESMEERLEELEMQVENAGRSELEAKNEHIAELQASLEEATSNAAKSIEEAQRAAAEETAEVRAQLEAETSEVKAQLEEAAGENEALKQQLEDIGDVSSLKERAAAAAEAEAERDAAQEAAKKAEAKMEEHWEMLKKEQVLRKKLHNQVEDMKGKIRVFARGRPMSASEKERGCSVSVDYLDVTTVATRDPEHRSDKTFTFDAVFPPEVGQAEVFEDCEQLLESVMDGYNVCVFAYGQTGSGKTWTMGGVPGNEGLTPRCVSTLFERLEEQSMTLTYQVSCYFVELYNDGLVDLLQKVYYPKEKPKKLDIKLNKKKQVYVKNAEVRPAADANEMMTLFAKGNAARHVGATKMNAESSRSHSIFSILVETTAKTTGKTNSGKLSLIDLAGSERAAKTGATPEQLKEANSINKSLSCLGDVISALTDGDSYIPYRNNKLTLLMQDSLGGNAKTLMFVNFSPADYNFDETNGSLTYAQRVKQIKNTAEKTQETKEVKKLNSEIQKLKGMLESTGIDVDAEDADAHAHEEGGAAEGGGGGGDDGDA